MEDDKIRNLNMEKQKLFEIERQLNLVYTNINHREYLSAKFKLRWIIDQIREEIEVENKMELIN